MNSYDFSGWATRANMKCSDGRTIMKNAFIDNDGTEVPLVWNHQHNEVDNVLGHALLENRDEGVYAYCTFNDSERGKMGRELVKHGDIKQLSIYANKLKQEGGNVIHGAIREVSLVLAGANPGAFIDSVMCHSDNPDEEGIIYTGEDIVLAHSEDNTSEEKDEALVHAGDDNKNDEKPNEGDKEEKNMADNATKKEAPEQEKTVKDVFDTLTEEQKTVVYALIGQALEDAGVSDDDEEDEDVKHSEGGNDTMYTNVFDRNEVQQVNVLTHADQKEILDMAKRPGMTLKSAMEVYAEEHSDTLAHGFETTGENAIEKLFPEFTDVHPGAPELLERDHEWVGTVMNKAHKSPVSRVRTRQIDARAQEIRAKGYKNRETEKAISGKVKLLMRTTDPQTIYYKDTLHRDDITDITDFDVVAYQRKIMKNNLEEEIALAALVGDGREDTHADKIHEEHVRSVWHDDDLYTIKAPVDVAAMKTKLQGTNTGANFGDEFVYAEAIIAAVMKARIQYKGKGTPDFYVEPNMLNTMLLARDMNGRRIYDSAEDLAKVLNVGKIYTVEQFADLDPREDAESNKFKLLGLIVNMANYQFGATKGGEITSFEDFDIDFNTYKYLMETRLSGALTEVYSAIALEEPVVDAG